MKIVHVVIGNSYTDGWAYQENLLPEAHYRLGNEVTVIASTENSLQATEQSKIPDKEYSINGVKIIRLKPDKIFYNIRFSTYSKLYDVVKSKNPDLIFIHGLNFLSLYFVREYKKRNPDCVIFADTHADQYNSIQKYKLLNKYIIHKGLWRYIIHKNIDCIDKIYYTTTGSKVFAETIYNIPEDKLEYLPMGGDDVKNKLRRKNEIKEIIRKKYNVNQDDILIVTGGRFERRKNIDILLKAFNKINQNNLKLIIFGKFIDKNYENEIMKLIDLDDRVKFIGWINPEETTDIFVSADLGVFPGTQSVIWRNAVACGLPLICKYTLGAEEIDVNGNVIHMFTDETWAWEQVLRLVVNVPELLKYMKDISLEYGTSFFDNERIAKKVLDDFDKIKYGGKNVNE